MGKILRIFSLPLSWSSFTHFESDSKSRQFKRASNLLQSQMMSQPHFTCGYLASVRHYLEQLQGWRKKRPLGTGEAVALLLGLRRWVGRRLSQWYSPGTQFPAKRLFVCFLSIWREEERRSWSHWGWSSEKSYFQSFIKHDINLNLEIPKEASQAMPPSRGNTTENSKSKIGLLRLDCVKFEKGSIAKLRNSIWG